MRWSSASSTGPDAGENLREVTDRVRDALPDGRADVAFVFLALEHAGAADEVVAELRSALGGPHVLGATMGGVIGRGREFEHVPALAVLAGRMPGVAVHGFHLRDADLPDPDAPPHAWQEAVGVAAPDEPAFVLLADPFSVQPGRLLDGLDFAYPPSVKVGGLGSGGSREGEQILMHGDRVVREGVIGAALMGDVELSSAVSQGCRPVGPPVRITDCENHLLRAANGRPVLDVVQEILSAATEQDRQLAQRALFLGFETDPFTAADEGPWLIRNLLGVDQQSAGIYVGEVLRSGRRVRFHVRDRRTSAEDVERVLDGAKARGGAAPEGALLFSCLGRGKHLYGVADHDARAFDARFPDVPLGGAFCGGEIGQVGQGTYVHGYTSVFGLFRPRANGEEPRP